MCSSGQDHVSGRDDADKDDNEDEELASDRVCLLLSTKLAVFR